MFKKYENLSLFAKISFVICGLAFALSSILTLTAVVYYRYISSERLLGNISRSTLSAASTLSVNYTDIVEQFVRACGTEDFKSDVEELIRPTHTYSACKRLVQEELTALSGSNYLIHSAMILSGDGKEAYSLFNNPLYEPAELLFSSEELRQIRGITLLPERKSPFRSRVSVIPILFPLHLVSQYVEIDLTGAVPDIYVVIFVDSSRLQTALNLSNLSQSRSVYYLLTEEGTLLNPPQNEEELFSPSEKEQITVLINSVKQNPSTCRIYTSSDSYLAVCRPGDGNFFLLNCVSRESLGDVFGRTGPVLLLLLLFLVSILLIVAFMMTRYITRPVNHLVETVEQIGQGTYQERQTFSTRDEIGQLGNAINSMYDTICLQMTRIKQEEEEKYKTQIQLLTEQINPHFLYNTLECIQSEVLRGNSGTATNMIQYLAEYLRIGLSYGADLISISSELRHADVYIRLMNQRFQQSIIFMYKQPPELNRLLIPKTILQPLVENSIRHGFGIDASGIPISVPTIEVNFRAADNRLSIEVIDNGSGFDCKRVEDIALGRDPREAGRHVGLRNVYYRLEAYYGRENVRISCSSIPYYRNEIILEIPLPGESSPDTASV